MSNSAIGRSDAPLPKLEKELPVFGAGDLPLAVQAGMWHPIRPRSAMDAPNHIARDAQFAFTIMNRVTAPFVAAFEDATARLLPQVFRYVVPAIDARLNARQRRYIRRRLQRELDLMAARIIATGRP